LLGVVGVPDKKAIPLTVPRTPAFGRQEPQNPPKRVRMRRSQE